MGRVWLYLFQTLRKKQIQILVRTNINSGKVLNETFAFLKITFKGLPLNFFFRVVKFQDFFYETANFTVKHSNRSQDAIMSTTLSLLLF